ncbi:hypothetical protein FLP10_15065 [Agromyces intestinalis]|uniref:EcsC family protein n=1 Tax=Agromyces intestinalis TaxID=2592652 RepID=A0A5C1YI04_9MICO|nr:hypothetical protein [Agromyces intestinalis]QEO15601.1 hypothetical protein FLP10_15065 [Agromyces intestinalis]
MVERVHRITSMGAEAPREVPDDAEGARVDEGRAHGVERTIDRVLAIQRPVVVLHLRGIRRRFPNATPDQLVRILEKRYLAAVTTGGAAVGATAVIPGISTGITLALSGVETAGFLEATALFAQSVAEVHGIPIENPDRARALVMTLMLGREGSDLVRQFAAQATGTGIARNAYWGELITNTLPKAVMGTVVDRLRTVFVKQFAVRGGAGFLGKALPFGVGAAVGGIGNNVLGRRVLAQSRLAFGQAPVALPAELEPGESDGMLQTAGGRIASAGSALGGAVASVAVASARGIRRAGAATGAATARGAKATGAATARGAKAITRRHGAADAPAETDGPEAESTAESDDRVDPTDSTEPPAA